MDIVDRAPDLGSQVLAARTEQMRLASDTPSLTHCEECGEPIPEARRVAVSGCRLCVKCQEECDR